MKMSDVIAEFIGEMLMDGGGVAEIQRKELANRFSCVPSQINYVIDTRFSPKNGYLVESRRGGGGYIRIMRIISDKQTILMEAANSFGDAADFETVVSLTDYLVKSGVLTNQEACILRGAVSNRALQPIAEPYQDQIRAAVLKNGLMSLIK